MPTDKKTHFAVCCLIAGVVCVVSYGLLRFSVAGATLAGFFSSVFIGGSKELVWDKMLRRGTPEWADFWADAAGAFTASVVFWVLFGIAEATLGR